jgi:Skp family chaperone for outer membrane proteins
MTRTGLTGTLVAAVVVTGVFATSKGLLAQNQTEKVASIACVDVGMVFNEYERMKDLRDELQRLEQNLNEEDKQRRENLDIMQNTLQNMDPNDPAYAKKMSDILETSIQHKTWYEVQQTHLTREIALAFDRVYRDILATTEEVASISGYDLVVYREPYEPTALNPDEIRAQMRARKVLYCNDAIDISSFVLDKLNANWRSKPSEPQIQIP